jgi:ParB/RepB/Spo0J family partition protein
MSLQDIPLGQIEFSATTAQDLRRSMIDTGQMQELAESIKSVGVLQPILVRSLASLATGAIRYQCVAGERRLRAAAIAGLGTIPATVRELTDGQVVELQLIENLQRQDIHELAEAEGYEQLLELGHDVDAIAAKVGKSRGTIYARMKLLALTPAARKAFYHGKIAASVALLLARIPVPKLQDQALKEVAAERQVSDLDTDQDYREQMSVRAATAHIHANYMLRLADAGFPTQDPDLVPAAGTCGACPKRTGNQPQLFGDVKGADVCTDPMCFKQKIAAHAERVIAQAKGTGQRVIVGKEAEKLAQYGLNNHVSGMSRLDAKDYNHDGAGRRTYRQTLGKDYVPVLIQDPDTGKMIEFAPDKDIEKSRGRVAAEDNSGWRTQQRAADRKHRLAIAYRLALFKAVREASPKRKQLSREELEDTVERLYGRIDRDGRKRLLAACGHEPKKRTGKYVSGVSTDWPVMFKQMTDDELVQMVRDCILAHDLQHWQHSGKQAPTDLEAAAKRVGVNAARIQRQIEEAAAAKRANGKKAKRPRAKK